MNLHGAASCSTMYVFECRRPCTEAQVRGFQGRGAARSACWPLSLGALGRGTTWTSVREASLRPLRAANIKIQCLDIFVVSSGNYKTTGNKCFLKHPVRVASCVDRRSWELRDMYPPPCNRMFHNYITFLFGTGY